MIMLNKQNINKFLCSKFLCSKFSPSAASSYLGFNAPEFIRFYSTSGEKNNNINTYNINGDKYYTFSLPNNRKLFKEDLFYILKKEIMTTSARYFEVKYYLFVYTDEDKFLLDIEDDISSDGDSANYKRLTSILEGGYDFQGYYNVKRDLIDMELIKD